MGFPAHAGMDPGDSEVCLSFLRLPRARGDGPPPESLETIPPMASPRTRGWTLALIRRGFCRVGFPAHAGMDPKTHSCFGTPRRLPRARGDGPFYSLPCPKQIAASPRTRGWTLVPCFRLSHLTGFPAHAGMDPSPLPGTRSCCWLPRARGDGPLYPVCDRAAWPASPRTRGWTPS